MLGNTEIDVFEMVQDTNQEIDNETNENEDDVYDPHISSNLWRRRSKTISDTKEDSTICKTSTLIDEKKSQQASNDWGHLYL